MFACLSFAVAASLKTAGVPILIAGMDSAIKVGPGIGVSNIGNQFELGRRFNMGVALLEGPVIRGFSVNEPLILLQAPPDSLHNPPSEAFWGVGLLGWH